MVTKIRLSPSGPELTYPLSDAGKVLTVDAAGQVVPAPGAGVPAPATSRMIFVSPPSPAGWGSDATGDGSEGKPFATIAHAQSIVTTPSLARIWDIVLFPGTYAEDVVLRAFTRLVGWDPSLSDAVGNPAFIDGSLVLAPGAEWQTPFAVAGVTNITVSGSITLDYWSLLSTDGHVAFTRCNLSGAIVLSQSSGNSTDLHACVLDTSANSTQTGGVVNWYNTAGTNSALQLIVSPATSRPATFNAYGGGWAGTLHADQAGITDQTVTINFEGFSVAGNVRITAAGALCPTITAPIGAIPPNPTLDGSVAVKLSPNMQVKTTVTIPIGSTFLVGEVDPVLLPLPGSLLGGTSIEDCDVLITSVGSAWQTQLTNAIIIWSWSVQMTGTAHEIYFNPLNLPAPAGGTLVTTEALLANVHIIAR